MGFLGSTGFSGLSGFMGFVGFLGFTGLGGVSGGGVRGFFYRQVGPMAWEEKFDKKYRFLRCLLVAPRPISWAIKPISFDMDMF